MIRTKDKILGEPNDPNTVLASGFLTDGSLLVGAGNKGIKSYIAKDESILISGLGGEVSEFNYRIPNKLIGTDESGSLKLYNRPKYTDFISFGSIDNPLLEVLSRPQVDTLTFKDLDFNKVSIDNSDILAANSVLVLKFTKPLIIPEEQECYIDIMIVSDLGAFGNLTLEADDTTKVILNTSNVTKYAISANKKISLPASTYRLITIELLSELASFSNKSLVISGLINYKG